MGGKDIAEVTSPTHTSGFLWPPSSQKAHSHQEIFAYVIGERGGLEKKSVNTRTSRFFCRERNHLQQSSSCLIV